MCGSNTTEVKGKHRRGKMGQGEGLNIVSGMEFVARGEQRRLGEPTSPFLKTQDRLQRGVPSAGSVG